MLCASCGKELPVDALHCPACGTAKSGTPKSSAAGSSGPGVMDRVKAASTDSLNAFKSFALNPIGELANVFNSLGETRALGVGISFGAVSAICFVLAAWLMLHKLLSPSAGWYLKLFVYAFIPVVTTAAASFVARKILKSDGAIGVDSFIAGTAMLPFAFATVLISIVISISSNPPGSLISFLMILGVTWTILILFIGFLRIAKLSERSCTLVVPLVITVSGWLTQMLYTQLLNSGFGGGGAGPGFGGTTGFN